MSSKSKAQEYTLLNNLQTNTKVNVYGVIKFIKQPYQTRGSDYCTVVSIIDQSYTGLSKKKLTCVLFSRLESTVSDANVGDIIRFHRLAIREYNGELQGQNSPGLAWLLFSGNPNDPLEPKKSISKSFTLTDLDKKRVQELRLWSNGEDDLQKTLCCFDEVICGNYFDLVCQVVYTSVLEPGVSRLFKVWDGTQCQLLTRDMHADSEEQDVFNHEVLRKRASGFTYDVAVFDDHFNNTSDIKPGDYVKFVNLHAAEVKPGDKSSNSATTSIEFCLHRGTSYGRCMKVISPNSSELDIMKQKQEIVALENESFSFSLSSVSSGSSSENVQNSMDEITEIDKIVKGGNLSKQTKEKGSNLRTQTHTGRNAMESLTSTSKTRDEDASECNISKDRERPDGCETDSDRFKQPVNTGDSMTKVGETKRRKLDNNKQKQDKLPSESMDSSELENSSCGLDYSITLSCEVNTDNSNKETDSGRCVEDSTRKKCGKSVLEKARVGTSRDVTESGGVVAQQERVISRISIPVSDGNCGKSTELSSNRRCMIKTSTVILDHPHVDRSTVRQVLDHAVPYKFRVLAQVYDYHPKLRSVNSFLKLYCSECHYLCSLPDNDQNDNNSADSALRIGSTFKGVPHYNCPRCLEFENRSQGLDPPPHLEYIYMLRLILKDDTGMLMANLWRSDAVKVFQDIEPEQLLKCDEEVEHIRDLLYKICPEQVLMKERPWIECCLKSYSNSDGTGFQIFDTTIV